MAASGIAIPFGLSPFGRLFSSMTSSPLLTIRTLGCRSPSWLRATRMRNAHWRLFLCGVSGAPPAAAPSLFNLPRAVIHTFVCRTAVSFGFREPRYPRPLPEQPRESFPTPRPLALRARYHTRARSLQCAAPAAPAHRDFSIITRHAPVQSDLGTF
jgi:hypothetical protein